MFIEINNSEYKETITQQFEMSLFHVVRDIGYSEIYSLLLNNTNDLFNFGILLFFRENHVDFFCNDSPNIYFDEMF